MHVISQKVRPTRFKFVRWENLVNNSAELFSSVSVDSFQQQQK